MQASLIIQMGRSLPLSVTSSDKLVSLRVADIPFRESFYQFLNGWGNIGPSNVWASYDVESGSLTYLLLDCPRRTKADFLRRAQEDPTSLASCPFAIDAFIARECCDSWRINIDNLRDELLLLVGLYCQLSFLDDTDLFLILHLIARKTTAGKVYLLFPSFIRPAVPKSCICCLESWRRLRRTWMISATV